MDFQTLVENSRDMVSWSTLAPESKTLYMNRAGLKMLGLNSLADLQAMNPWDFFFPEDLARLKELEANLPAEVERTGYWEGELRLKNQKTGEAIPTHFSMAPIMDPQKGKLLGMASIGRDLTREKKPTEEIIKTLKTDYKEIFDKASDAIFVHEVETGRVLDVNQRAVEMTGYSREELIGEFPDISSGNPGYTREDAGKWIQKTLTEGPQIFEWQGRHKDGTIHWIEVSLSRAVIGGKNRLLAFFRNIGDRKKTEEMLHSQNLFLAAVDSIRDYAVFLLDTDGKVLTWNQGAERIKGYKPSEIIGKSFALFYTPKENAESHPQELLKKAAREGRAEEEGWRVKKDGTQFLADVVITALKDDKGELRGFIKVTKDVTEIRKKEEEILRLATLVETSRDMISWGSPGPESKTLYINKAGLEMLGIGSLADMQSLKPEDLIFAEDMANLKELEKEAPEIEKRGYWEGEIRLRNQKTGAGIPVHFSMVMLKDPKTGQPLGTASIGRDMRDIKKAEEELKRLAVLVETSLDFISISTVEGQVLYMNPAGRKLLGVELNADITRYRRQDFNDPDNLQKVQSQSLPSLVKESHWEGELNLRHVQTGESIPVYIKSVILKDPSTGEPTTITTIGRDMREQKRQQELKIYAKALEVSNKELQDFVFVASHDLQEPLRKIQSFGEFLSDEYGKSLEETGQDYLQRMREAANRMQILINDLLTLTRVTTKAQPFAPVDLSKVIEVVLSDLETRIQEKNAKVEVGELPTIDADTTQMRQLFQNLISNALKFQKRDVPPVIQVTASTPEAGKCQIQVKDNGIGFDNKYAEQIFKVFERLHGRDEYEGTGIGLAICRKVVERHGGAIKASGEPGKGSIFTVTLPFRQKRLGGNHD